MSVRYLHMHVMSTDLAGEGMKHSKHFFSFLPEYGSFLPIDEVLDWFDVVESRYEKVSYTSNLLWLRLA